MVVAVVLKFLSKAVANTGEKDKVLRTTLGSSLYATHGREFISSIFICIGFTRVKTQADPSIPPMIFSPVHFTKH